MAPSGMEMVEDSDLAMTRMASWSCLHLGRAQNIRG